MSSANKVADIFSTAGEAFSRLGALAMELQNCGGENSTGGSEEGKWGDEEIELLRQAVLRFGNDLEKISTQIKTKSVGQIRSALKQKAVQQKVGLTTPKGIEHHRDERVVIEQTRAPANKRIRVDDDNKIVVEQAPDNLLLANANFDGSSIIESALNKLKYDTKDPHADIDIEG